ncbi:Phospholipase A2 group XV [Halotydeus destructor]|nr:Phospholipase A2 group XV [Halotydeus destructor]
MEVNSVSAMTAIVCVLLLLTACQEKSTAIGVASRTLGLLRHTDAILKLMFQLIVSALEPTSADDVSAQRPRYPVILVPGFGGSQLEAKVNQRPWKRIYLNHSYFQAPLKQSFKEQLTLTYNSTSGHTRSAQDVQVRPFKFGDIAGVGYFDESSQFVQALVALNYTLHRDLRGAPYDFRRSPNDNVDFGGHLKRLIEETFYTNNKTPVYLVTSSQGCVYTLYFLRRQSQAWKDVHIKAFVPVSSPWAGTTASLKNIAEGHAFRQNDVSAVDYRELIRGWSTTFSLVPSPGTFVNQVLVSFKGKNYTAKDNDAIFDLFAIPNAKDMYRDSRALSDNIPHPMVDVFCIHGNGNETVETLVYDTEEQFPGSPNFTYGPGDGVVNMVSLEACRRWSRVTKYKFNYSVIDGADHRNILSDDRMLELLNRILTSH